MNGSWWHGGVTRNYSLLRYGATEECWRYDGATRKQRKIDFRQFKKEGARYYSLKGGQPFLAYNTT